MTPYQAFFEGKDSMIPKNSLTLKRILQKVDPFSPFLTGVILRTSRRILRYGARRLETSIRPLHGGDRDELTRHVQGRWQHVHA